MIFIGGDGFEKGARFGLFFMLALAVIFVLVIVFALAG